MKKFLFLIIAGFLFSNCTHVALSKVLDVAQGLGAFEKRTYYFPKKHQGDTLIYYKGYEEYVLIDQRKDSLFRFDFIPNRERTEAGLNKILKLKPKGKE